MRIVKILLLALAAAVLIVYTAVMIHSALLTDKTPPVITFSSDTVEMSVNDDRSALLAGVSAADNKDGDLSTEVMIRGISQFIDDRTAQVSYIVFDSSDNMATATRSVVYTDYVPPHFALTEPLVFTPSVSVALSSRLSAADVLDGDVSDSIRLVSSNLVSNTEGEYAVTVQVTNSMGDTAEVTLPVIIRRAIAQMPVLELTDALIYLPVGADFSPSDYFHGLWETAQDMPQDTLSASDGDETGEPAEVDETGMRHSMYGVTVESNVNTAEPGCYQVLYRYENEYGYGSCIGLTVVVE